MTKEFIRYATLIVLLMFIVTLLYLFFKFGYMIGSYQAQLDCISVILK